MGISLRIGRDVRSQINQAVRTAGVSVVEALLVDAIRHLLPAEEPQETVTDSAQTNTSTTTHEGVTQ